MEHDRPAETGYTISVHTWEFFQEAARRRWHANEQWPEAPLTFRQLFGEEPIQLEFVEFQILLFLASKPYHPFTRRRIAEAVTSASHPVTEEHIDQYIASLRNQLGFFHDFVQTVPHMGYRFKA